MLRTVRFLVLLSMLGGCGQVGFELLDVGSVVEDASSSDAAAMDAESSSPDAVLADSGPLTDSGAGDDAAPDGGTRDAGGDSGVARCDEWTAGSFTFDVTGPITTGSITGERGEMRVTRDGSMMYFGFDGDVYQAPRVSELVFEPATPVLGLDTAQRTFGANLTADGLSALVMVDGGGHVDIWRYDRATTSDAFTPTRAMDELNTSGDDWDPLLTTDGLGLYFGRALDDVGSVIYTRRPTTDSAFTIEESFFNLPFGVLANPSFTEDERVLVINSVTDRSHIYYSIRASRGTPFTELTLLPGVQERTETEPYLTPDGCELYYTAQSDTDGYRMLLARYRRL